MVPTMAEGPLEAGVELSAAGGGVDRAAGGSGCVLFGFGRGGNSRRCTICPEPAKTPTNSRATRDSTRDDIRIAHPSQKFSNLKAVVEVHRDPVLIVIAEWEVRVFPDVVVANRTGRAEVELVGSGDAGAPARE